MTRRRWIADRVSGNQAALTGDHANHLVRVLRARVGQEFDIVAGAVVRRGRIVNIADERVDFELGEEVSAGPSPPRVSLWLAIFKFDRMEWAIEKTTELGVSRIIPVIARRTDTHLASASVKRADRWKRIALEASEQSRRAAPPEIAAPVRSGQVVTSAAALKIVLSESENQTQLRDAVREHKPEPEVELAVGPEGGWTADEIELFHQEGWLSASLGPTVLRAETAAIAAIAITFSELG